jgi:uncharacterized protein YggU (UPF0235/DUF167 family)
LSVLGLFFFALAMKNLKIFLAEQRDLLQSESAIFLRLKIIPNTNKTEWKELLVQDDQITVKLRVAAVPEKGKANKIGSR